MNSLLSNMIRTDDLLPFSEAANENRRLMPEWMTTAELLQLARQEKRRLIHELAENACLWRCPEYRIDWTLWLAIEQLAHRQGDGR